MKVGHYASHQIKQEDRLPERVMVDDGLVVRFERKSIVIDCFCGNGTVVYRGTKCTKTCEYCEMGRDITDDFAAAIINQLWSE